MKKRILGILMALVMVSGLMPAAAFAADGPYVYIDNIGMGINGDTTYYVNGDNETRTAARKEVPEKWNAKFQMVNGNPTLTIDGLEVTAKTENYKYNSTTSASAGLCFATRAVNENILIVKNENHVAGGTTASAGITWFQSEGIMSRNLLTIQGDGVLFATGGDLSGNFDNVQSYGIYMVEGGLEIKDNVTIYAKGSTVGSTVDDAYSYSCGIGAATDMEKGTVIASGKTEAFSKGRYLDLEDYNNFYVMAGDGEDEAKLLSQEELNIYAVQNKTNEYQFEDKYVKVGTMVNVAEVALDKTDVSINVGETAILTATVSPENATDKTVTWTSSDETVATVENGVVTAVGAGAAKITVTTADGEKTATCEVTVTAPSSDDEEQPSEGGDATPSQPSSKKTKRYDVAVDKDDVENGSVKVSSSRAKRGSTVTITVTPDDGYELDELIVLDDDGDEIELTDKGDGKYSFTMPRGDVEIEASFKEIEKDVPAIDADEEETLVLTIDSNIYQQNGEYLVNDVAPVIKDGSTMLPIRLVAEFLGADVAWNEAEQSVTITKDGMEIVIYIGQAFALVNGEPVELDAPAFIVNDRTYLPVRFVAENLGAEVIWNEADRTVTIRSAE